MYSWGENDQGQLGLGHHHSQAQPTLIADLANVTVTKLYCGFSNSMIQDSNNDVYLWGNNEDYQLGLGHCGDISRPTKVSSSWIDYE